MKLDISGLNPEQQDAVKYVDGPLLVLAGAGSGKTRVLVHRIAYLIYEAGIPPWGILAITFTNKAAKEMKSRVESMLPDLAATIWISTFHSTCIRILRRDIERIGFDRHFTICDYDDQLSLVKECIKELNLNDKQYIPKSILEQIGHAKDELLDPEAYYRINHNDFRKTKVYEIYKQYQKKLKKANSLDFDDIILLTVRLFQQEQDVLEYYQNRFRHILVDEYQDTNMAQYQLIMLLSGKWKNLCVVGDDDQSIYGWRGANIGNILGFENDFQNAKVIKLEQNYRSTKMILDAANAVILKNAHRKAKKLWTQNETGAKIICAKAPNEHEEAALTAGEIKRLRIENGESWNDYAILYRINAQSRVMENMLIREGIPYRIVGGFKFFDRKEIKDIVAYLRLIQNPVDDISFKRIINVPKRGIGATTVEKIESIAFSENKTLMEVIQKAQEYAAFKNAAPKLKLFADLINECITAAKTMPITELLDFLLNKTGIMREYELSKTEESQARIENILEFKTEIIEFEKNYQSDDQFFEEIAEDFLGKIAADAANDDEIELIQKKDNEQLPDLNGIDNGKSVGLSEFLMHIALISDIDNFEEEEEKVSLMTIHSAKGLEFNSVFIIGAEEGLFPGIRAMTDMKQLEEERRLCYVAITRAKRRLYVTNATTRTIFGNTTYNRLSRFISDIPGELISKGNGRRNLTDSYVSQKNAFSGISGEQHFIGSFRNGIARNDIFQTETTQNRIRQNGQDFNESAFIDRDKKTEIHRAQTYEIGESVSHKKYGVGKVISRNRDKDDIIIEVEFDRAGKKRFIESMVNLGKL